MKLWIDDVRPMPNDYDYFPCLSVNGAKKTIQELEDLAKIDPYLYKITLIDIDHDAGDFAYDGGDYIQLLNWLEETGRNYPIRIHSMNPVGVENMRRIIERNGWTEVK